MEFVALGCAGVGVDGNKGRSSGEAAEDFAGIDEKGFAGLRDFELVVVAKADDIVAAGLGEDPADVVVVSQTKAASVNGNCRHFAVELNMRKGAAVLCDAEEIAVVVAKDDVDVAEVVLAEFVDNKGRTKVAATEESVGMLELFQCPAEGADIVVNVREDADLHGWVAGSVRREVQRERFSGMLTSV